MSALAFLIVFAIAAGGWYALYRSRHGGPARGEHGTLPQPPAEKCADDTISTASFASVEIKLAADSCAAARALDGIVLLASDAPPLPLEDCDRRCRCSFRKRSDRRYESRRWADEGVAATVFSAAERRRTEDRRKP